MKAADIIDMYEVPEEFHDAVFEAYAEGAKRGFIDAQLQLPTCSPPPQKPITGLLRRNHDQ